MQCRDAVLAGQARADILAVAPHAAIHAIECDLASLASVRRAAAELRASGAAIDLLINNAGIVCTRHRMSPDGFELTFATNHLGPYLLTRELLPAMASRVHRQGVLELDRVPDPKARYRPTAAYAQSKLANVMHAFALARRLAGTGITVNCLHPGVVATNLLPRWLQIVKPWFTRQTFDAERGAATTLHLALSTEVAGRSGHYFDENQQIQPASAAAQSVEQQEQLMAKSERWTATV
jgi:NAD(P)-dependent dehydrogenase (short-subunit alcohol dehydrogenase family)